MSASGYWNYVCELPNMTVSADPPDIVFKQNITVHLNAEVLGNKVDAKILYVIDSTGATFTTKDVKKRSNI